MKGIILAGGLATRLYPLNISVNKHLLPVYSKPMIFYPIQTLVQAGITDIMLVVSGPHSGSFLPVLKNGEDFGCSISYAYQSKPDGGIADALSICEAFAEEDDICVILGDNTTDANITKSVIDFIGKSDSIKRIGPVAHLFLRQVPDAHRFGVATVVDNRITKIVEKPTNPESNLAVTGLYLYDKNVFEFIHQCKPSERGELEITDVNNLYINAGNVYYSMLEGFWKDAGTFDSLLEASNYWKSRENSG